MLREHGAAARRRARALGLALIGLTPATVCTAQDAADFYRGKTVRILVGGAVGGDYDVQARLISRHIGRHLPGEPTVIVENMTGAGGMNMANHLYLVASKDGTVLGVIQNNFPVLQWAGGQGVQYDVTKFNWLGSLTQETQTMVAWAASGVKTIEDVMRQEVVAGATGRGAITYTYPAMFNALLGTKFKIVIGYTGGADVNLAMERGEVVSRINSWTSWKVTKPEWVKNGLINILVQSGPRHPDLAHVPSVEDKAKSDEDRQLIALVNSGSELGRPVTAPPNLPPERVKTLREALRKTSDDPALKAEALKMGMELNPVSGEEMQQKIARLLATPKSLLPRTKDFLE